MGKSAEKWRAEVRALVVRTTAEQGVPLWVSDARVIGRVVTLMDGAGAGGRRQRAKPRAAPAPAPS